MVQVVRSFVVLVVAAILACVPACSRGGNSNSGKPKVAVVTNGTDPFWDIVQAGAYKGGEDFNVEVIFKQPENSTVELQMTTIANLQKLGIQGLAASVINPKEQTPGLKLVADDLPKHNFITMDNDAKDTGRLCYVGIDNIAAGKEAGRMVKRALPSGGTIVLLIGNKESANAHARISGVLSELAGRDVFPEVSTGKYEAKYGNYILHRGQPLTDQLKKDVATSNAAASLEELAGTPNVCFVGLYAYNPAKVLEQARLKTLVGKVKIVGFDEDLVTLDGIEKGEIEGSVSQDPYAYGYESVRWLAHTIKDGKREELPQKPSAYSVITRDGKLPPNTEPGVTAKKASDYAKLVSDAYKAAKAGR